jgi:hypothetical protein
LTTGWHAGTSRPPPSRRPQKTRCSEPGSQRFMFMQNMCRNARRRGRALIATRGQVPLKWPSGLTQSCRNSGIAPTYPPLH